MDDVEGTKDYHADFANDASTIGKLRTANLVATFDVNAIVPIHRLVADYPNMFSLYQQDCKFHMKRPRTTISIFASGKALLVGARTLAEVNAAVWQFVGILQTHGVPEARVRDVRPRNNTSTTVMSDGLFDLPRFQKEFEDNGNVLYEPMSFPGARIRFKDSSAVMLGFMSNAFNITGANTIQEAQHAFMAIKEIHEQFVVRDPVGKRKLERTIELMRLGVVYETALDTVTEVMAETEDGYPDKAAYQAALKRRNVKRVRVE
jgi:TATA-box binding protein (TBP) (component of TFIID and TFIIIB)